MEWTRDSFDKKTSLYMFIDNIQVGIGSTEYLLLLHSVWQITFCAFIRNSHSSTCIEGMSLANKRRDVIRVVGIVCRTSQNFHCIISYWFESEWSQQSRSRPELFFRTKIKVYSPPNNIVQFAPVLVVGRGYRTNRSRRRVKRGEDRIIVSFHRRTSQSALLSPRLHQRRLSCKRPRFNKPNGWISRSPYSSHSSSADLRFQFKWKITRHDWNVYNPSTLSPNSSNNFQLSSIC